MPRSETAEAMPVLAHRYPGVKLSLRRSASGGYKEGRGSMTTPVAVKMSARMTGAERKKRIVEATTEVVAKFGVQGATTSRIAAASGIAEKTLYSHFPSRREILVAALDKVLERSRDNFRRRTETDARELLRAAARRHWSSESEFVYPLYEFFAAPPEEGLREEIRTRHQVGLELVINIVNEGKAQGVIRPDVDAEQTVIVEADRSRLGRARRNHSPTQCDAPHPAGDSRRSVRDRRWPPAPAPEGRSR